MNRSDYERFASIMSKLESTCNKKHNNPEKARKFSNEQNGNLKQLQLENCFRVIVNGCYTFIEIISQ